MGGGCGSSCASNDTRVEGFAGFAGILNKFAVYLYQTNKDDRIAAAVDRNGGAVGASGNIAKDVTDVGAIRDVFTVYLSGKPEEFATLIDSSTTATAAPVVEDATSKFDAEVRITEVTLSFMAPFSVVKE